MLTQFPISTIEPIRRHLKVNDKHSIYIEESGNPKGLPVLFVRGGPGGTPNIKDHAWFSPDKYRIIVFDQRGSGRCEPSAENDFPAPNFYDDITVEDFVADMEMIRQHLNITTWCLFGGSWGSTLALRYAQLHPQKVDALILRGIFLCTHDEMQLYFTLSRLKAQFSEFNPKAFTALIDYANSQLGTQLSHDDSSALLKAYKQLIIQNNDAIAMYLWAEFENYVDDFSEETLHKLLNPPKAADVSGNSRCHAIFQTLLFPQLAKNDFLLQPQQLQRLSGLTVYIVQGKQDTTCPMEYAIKLEEALKANQVKTKMILVEEGKHSPYSPHMTHELIKITNEWSPNNAVNNRYPFFTPPETQEIESLTDIKMLDQDRGVQTDFTYF